MSTDSSTFLIVGLGNPGEKYAPTRHNVGFWVVDKLAENFQVGKFVSKFKGLFAETSWDGKKVLLLKPQTFMNLSGESVQAAVAFYKLDPATQLMIVSDDLDLPPGQLRLRLFGGSGGHNGLTSVIECLATEQFPRLRMGIGRSSSLAAEEYVLTRVPKSERATYEQAVMDASSGIEKCIQLGIEKAMNFINQKRTDGA